MQKPATHSNLFVLVISKLLRTATRIIICGLVVYAWLWWTWFRFPAQVPETITWSTDQGPSSGVPGEEATDLYALRSSRGKLLYNPTYTFRHGQLLYWSKPDQSLGVVSVDRPLQWIPIKLSLPTDWTIESASPTPSGLILNASNDNVPPMAPPFEQSYAVELPSGKASPLTAFRSATSTETSSVIVGVSSRKVPGLTDSWRLTHTYRGVTSILGGSQDVVSGADYEHWDYDFVHDIACLMDRGTVTMIDSSNRRTTWSIGFPLLSPTGMTLQPLQRQVWIEAEGLFGIGQELLVFDYRGHFLCHGGVDPMMSKPIQMLTPQIHALFSRLSRPKPGDLEE